MDGRRAATSSSQAARRPCDKLGNGNAMRAAGLLSSILGIAHGIAAQWGDPRLRREREMEI
jgi:hypothetical protein